MSEIVARINGKNWMTNWKLIKKVKNISFKKPSDIGGEWVPLI